ncbi:MAG: tripartite tricarboxylate transporter permease [Candidatus Methanoplasma sp.]|nr:tripartite tricarboxylate transporter permease [Candidatus Methanoplasma sp.]
MEPGLFIIILLMCIIGSAAGCFTGLFPGIHVNTLSSVMLILYPSISGFVSLIADPLHAPILVSSLLMSAAVVHSFLDFVPSVFLGAPDPDEAMSVLPGHRLLMEGRGMDAVRAAAVGSIVGASAAVLLAVPVQYLMLQGLADSLEEITFSVLLFTVAVIMINERSLARAAWAAAMMLISGLMGAVCMSGIIPSFGILGEGTLLFPLLTGLFGMPALLTADRGARIPEQIDGGSDPTGPLPALKGVAVGCVAGWYPGITAAAGSALASIVLPERDPARFISLTASIGTVTAVFSLVTLSVSGSGRSGTVLVIRDIVGDIGGFCSEEFLILLLSTAIAAVLGYCMTIAAGKAMGRVAGRIDMAKANRAALAIVTVLVLLLTGPWGLVILASATVVGFIPQTSETDRVPLAGCLIVPVLLSEAGISIF